MGYQFVGFSLFQQSFIISMTESNSKKQNKTKNPQQKYFMMSRFKGMLGAIKVVIWHIALFLLMERMAAFKKTPRHICNLRSLEELLNGRFTLLSFKTKMFWVFKKIYVSKCEYRFNIKNSHYTAEAEVVPNFSVCKQVLKRPSLYKHTSTHM